MRTWILLKVGVAMATETLRRWFEEGRKILGTHSGWNGLVLA